LRIYLHELHLPADDIQLDWRAAAAAAADVPNNTNIPGGNSRWLPLISTQRRFLLHRAAHPAGNSADFHAIN
jgi:hypothetical protein